jgi:hypothetical protein
MLSRDKHSESSSAYLNESSLGISFHFDAAACMLSSDFDWLGIEAFDDFNVRNSMYPSKTNNRLPGEI